MRDLGPQSVESHSSKFPRSPKPYTHFFEGSNHLEYKPITPVHIFFQIFLVLIIFMHKMIFHSHFHIHAMFLIIIS